MANCVAPPPNCGRVIIPALAHTVINVTITGTLKNRFFAAFVFVKRRIAVSNEMVLELNAFCDFV